MSSLKYKDQVNTTTFATEENILENYLIITTVNKNYLKIFDLWYHFFKKSNYTSILRVITIDKESEEYISGKSIKTIHIGKSTSNFNKIVTWRFGIFYDLLKSGKSIIQTDADAIWVDPKLDQLINKKFDIQISTEYGIPEDVLSQWNFTLCTGFIIFQSNEKVLSFYKLFLDKCVEIKDDQIAFNHLLFENGMKWELNQITQNTGHLALFDLYIEAINYFTIGRTVEKESELFIYHPFLPSNNQNLKILDLIERLKLVSSDPFLDVYRRFILTSPKGWIFTAIGWASVVYHKAIRNAFKKYQGKKH